MKPANSTSICSWWMMAQTYHRRNFVTLIFRAITTQWWEKKFFVTNSPWLDSRICNTCQNIANNSIFTKCRYMIWHSPIDSRHSSTDFHKKLLYSFIIQISVPKTWKLLIVSLTHRLRMSALQLSLIMQMHPSSFVLASQDPSPLRSHQSWRRERKRERINRPLWNEGRRLNLDLRLGTNIIWRPWWWGW